MPKTSVAVGVTIGAALAAGYDRVFLRAEDRVRALGRSLREARARQAAADRVVQYRKKLQTLKRLQAEAGGESERFAGRIEKTRLALARAIRQAERYGIEVGSAAAAERRAAAEAARHEAALARLEKLRRNREARREIVGKALAVGGSLYGLGRLGEGLPIFRNQYFRKSSLVANNVAGLHRSLEKWEFDVWRCDGLPCLHRPSAPL